MLHQFRIVEHETFDNDKIDAEQNAEGDPKEEGHDPNEIDLLPSLIHRGDARGHNGTVNVTGFGELSNEYDGSSEEYGYDPHARNDDDGPKFGTLVPSLFEEESW